MDAPLTVLVAEDDETLAGLLVRILQGYAVLAAHDGLAALTVLQAGPAPVDVLLADIRMPRMSGDQVAFQAREHGLARHVLFMTGSDSHPETAQMLGSVLLEPFSPKDLTRAVAALIQGQPIH